MKILNQIQQKLKAPKGQFNSFGKYKYRSCEDIVEAVKPLLGQAVLTLSDEILHFGDTIPITNEEKTQTGDRYYVKATARLSCDGETVEASALAREPMFQKGMNDSQITGSASSYARKYALNGLFCIDDTKDADTMEGPPDPPRVTAKNKEVIEAVFDRLLDSVPDGRVLAYDKLVAFLYAKRGHYPSDISKAGVIAAWVITEKGMNAITKEKE